MILDKTCAIERLNVTVGDSDKEEYAAVGNMQSVRINIQPATPELTAITEGAYGQTFRAFVSVSGILIGDRLTDNGNGKKFIVKGVHDWYNALIPHLELVLFAEDN